jgi:DNA-binding CsgD family transcriptional regulator
MSQSQPSPSLQDVSDALSELVARAAGSVVAVHSGHSRSSGFVWRSGLIVAADEAVAEDADVCVVLPGGETVAATVVGRDPTTDVALLRIDETADVALVDAIGTAVSREAALTPRELEVLNLLAEGASNKVIARRLGISIHTAKFHVGSLRDKLDASGRTDAVAHAARLGVIQL